MKPLQRSVVNAVGCAALFYTGIANAHYFWIENHEAEARIYFGEADVLLKEKSPGKFDTVKVPNAFVTGVNGGEPLKPLKITRTPEYFAAETGKNAPAILAKEESADVRDLTAHGFGWAKTNYYARSGAAGAQSSALALDMQEQQPNTYTVLYKGKPVADAAVEVIAPNAWMQTHYADANGNVQIHTPWKGQYIIHILHIDKTAGEFAGKKYENLRNHLTYTLVKNEGADPGAAVPPQYKKD